MAHKINIHDNHSSSVQINKQGLITLTNYGKRLVFLCPYFLVDMQRKDAWEIYHHIDYLPNYNPTETWYH